MIKLVLLIIVLITACGKEESSSFVSSPCRGPLFTLCGGEPAPEPEPEPSDDEEEDTEVAASPTPSPSSSPSPSPSPTVCVKKNGKPCKGKGHAKQKKN